VISEAKFFRIFFQGNSRRACRANDRELDHLRRATSGFLANLGNASGAAKLQQVELRICEERGTAQSAEQDDLKKKKARQCRAF
jgi:hypothetical protein